MKKLSILFLLIMIALSIKANPIPTPKVTISELYFDNLNNWKLELINIYYLSENDSVMLYSKTDTVRVNINNYFNPNYYVITKDSLDTEFNINRHADSIKVIVYRDYGDIEKDSLIFGNVKGAVVSYPKKGQSITRFKKEDLDFFVNSNSPTIGSKNDEEGIYGTLKGVIYDKYSNPIKNTYFYFYEEKRYELDYVYYEAKLFSTSEKGEYSIRDYAKISDFNSIGMYGYSNWQPIKQLHYSIDPDSVVELDIHLLNYVTAGINNLEAKNTPISVYPNPVQKSKEFNIDMDLPIITSNFYVEIVDLNGKVINKKKINQKSTSIIAPENKGIYIIRIILDSEEISSYKIIVNE